MAFTPLQLSNIMELAGMAILPFKGKVPVDGYRAETTGYAFARDGEIVSYFIPLRGRIREVMVDSAIHTHRTHRAGDEVDIDWLRNKIAYRALQVLTDRVFLEAQK